MSAISFFLGKRILNRLGRPLGINPFPRAFDNPIASEESTRSGVFERVFLGNFWGSTESPSGVGSERKFTADYEMSLITFIEQRGIRCLFDAPCGDMNWMPSVISKTGIAYIGGDISASVVSRVANQHPGLDIRVFDICQDAFPEADVWHCRDCLFHLPIADIRLAFENFVKSNIPFLLATTHRARFLHCNLDTSLGGFRFLDLERPPFTLTKPDVYLPDYRRYVDFPRFMALWPRHSVESALKQWAA